MELTLSNRVKALKPSPTLQMDAKAKALKAEGVDIINLSAGEPDFDTPLHIKEAAKKAIDKGYTRYTAVGGIIELKEAIIDRLKRDYALDYSLTEVMVSTGGKQALYNAAQAILNPNDEVIIFAPYWVSYPPIVELAGARPIIIETVSEDNFSIDINMLRSAINDRTKAIIINSPSNPTGTIYDEAAIKQVAEIAIEHNLYIITDDIYDLIRFDGKGPYNAPSLVSEAKRLTIVVNGVSKTYAMTGWRIGYMAGPENVIKACTKIQSQSTSNPNSIAQYAALEALRGPDEFISEMREEFKLRCKTFVNGLMEIGGIKCPMPQGAFYCFPDISGLFGRKTPDGKTIVDSLSLSEYLLEKAQVASIPGIAFGNDNYIRFSFAASLSVLKEGLNRIEKVIKKLL